MSQVIKLSTSILKVHEKNIEFFDDIEGEAYERFKKSIEEDGVITPIIVAPDMTIISGHQRYQACKDLGIKLVPSIIREDLEDEDEQLKKLLATNFGRMKNNPVKQGRVYEQYEKLCGVERGNNQHSSSQIAKSQEDIAKELGVSVDTVIRLKKLQTLSPELQQLIEDGQVKYTTALNVWGKLSNEEQAEFIEQMGKEYISNLTAKETQEILDKYKQLEEEKKQAERVAWQAEQALKEVIEENEQLKNREPVIKERVPEHIKEKLLDLEEDKRELEKLRQAGMSVKEYESKMREKRKEYESLMNTMRELQQTYDKENEDITRQATILNRIKTAIEPLKKARGNIEQDLMDISKLSDMTKREIESEVNVAYSILEFVTKELNKLNSEVITYE